MKTKSVLRLFAPILAAMMLTACDPVPPASSGYTVSEEEQAKTTASQAKLSSIPRIDGSTANIPLAKLILERVTDYTAEEIEQQTKFTTTPCAYENLVNGNTDFLLIYEADAATKKAIETSGTELECHAIGKDALVFLVNDKNPVKSLTTRQIQDIYQGNITNWKTVGGEDKEIVAYQRAERSGSQALMVKLVMQNLKLMKAPTELYPQEMGGLIDALASYHNTRNAVGYSVYYYAENMYRQPGLKFMPVDGIAPTNETISKSDYPFINDFYAVIRKDEPSDSPARKLLRWVLSDEGSRTVADAGYVNSKR